MAPHAPPVSAPLLPPFHTGLSLSPSQRGFVPSPPLPSSPESSTVLSSGGSSGFSSRAAAALGGASESASSGSESSAATTFSSVSGSAGLGTVKERRGSSTNAPAYLAFPLATSSLASHLPSPTSSSQPFSFPVTGSGPGHGGFSSSPPSYNARPGKARTRAQSASLLNRLSGGSLPSFSGGPHATPSCSNAAVASSPNNHGPSNGDAELRPVPEDPSSHVYPVSSSTSPPKRPGYSATSSTSTATSNTIGAPQPVGFGNPGPVVLHGLGHRKRYSMGVAFEENRSGSRERYLSPASAATTPGGSAFCVQGHAPPPIGGVGAAGAGAVGQSGMKRANTSRDRNGSEDEGGGRSRTAANQLEAKVVILGMQGVGKTSIVHRYTTGEFSLSLASTIGASFCIKKLSVDNCKVRLQIWDTAGQERFRSMAPMYYRGANAAIIVYDITNEESFLDVENWIKELREMDQDVVIQVVGSKADLAPSQRAIDLTDAARRISQWTSNSPFTASSAATRPGGAELARTLSFGPLGFGRGRKSDEVERSRFRETLEEREQREGDGRWGRVTVTEVSAKDDYGIEDVFLLLTRRLVARKAAIDDAAWIRARDSVILGSDAGSDHQRPGASAGWCCA